MKSNKSLIKFCFIFGIKKEFFEMKRKKFGCRIWNQMEAEIYCFNGVYVQGIKFAIGSILLRVKA